MSAPKAISGTSLVSTEYELFEAAETVELPPIATAPGSYLCPVECGARN
jgi:hypothetical protein